MKYFKLTKWMLALPALMILVLTGCHYHEPPTPPPSGTPCNYGPAGYDGMSYSGLDWEIDKASYLWTDNDAIPHVFEYGAYYTTYPGTYRLYYEGSFYEGCCPTDYYWDVIYDVWYHPGTAGGPCGQPGTNGVDSWLMLVTSPYGPFEERTNKMAAETPEGMTIIEQTDDKVVVEMKGGALTIRATYNKLKASIKDQLDPSGVRIEKGSVEAVAEAGK